MNPKKHGVVWILVLVAWLAGCAPLSRFLPVQTPEATVPPTLAPTASPAPVNEKILAEGLALSPANANLVEKLADLWPPNQLVGDADFYDDGSIALAGGGSALTSGGGPSRIGNFELKGPGRITLWDIRTNSQRELLSSDEGKATYNMLAVSPDRKWVALAGSTAVVLGELQGGAESSPSFKSTQIDLSEIKEYGPLVGTAFSADSRLLAVVGQSGGILVWDVQAGRKFAALPVAIGNSEMMIAECMFSIYGAGISPDGKTLLHSCSDAIHTWDFKAAESVSSGMLGQTVFALNPAGNLVAGGDYFGKVSLWPYPIEDPSTYEKPQTVLSGQATMITALAFSPDGSLLASASQDGKIVIYDLAGSTNLTTLAAPADFLAFSPDGKFLLSGTHKDGGALWGVRSGSINAERAGVKVILSEGSVPLPAWNALVPAAWLVPEGSFPLHEIRISSEWHQVETCHYSGDESSIGFLNRRQPTVTVEIANVETNSVVAKEIFEGGEPDGCPETWTFDQFAPSDFIDGTAPDVTPFGPWLAQVMGKVGYE